MNLKTVTLSIEEDNNASLLTHLRIGGHVIPAYCAGKGVCGKCKVRFLEHAPQWKENEEKVFTREELEDGWRLACETKVTGTVRLELADIREKKIDRAVPSGENSSNGGGSVEYVAAVDIGTTTIAVSKIETRSKTVIDTVTGMNDQKVFGADVISRIDAANHGKGMLLQVLLRNTLKRLYQKLGLSVETTKSVISCNTTMGHLLQGYSCKSLGVAPYHPVDISLHTHKNMIMLPGISTFVGADIVSGMAAVGMNRREKVCLLVDIGTNGEMAIGNRERILVTSTAAGPVFEGGNISCGMAAIPGAIERVTIEADRTGTKETFLTSMDVIGNEEPVGLCGSGVLDMVYELAVNGLMDETGLLREDYLENGYPLGEKLFFTAKDIRQVQLAKAAIRTGIEILMKEYGVTAKDIDKLYLAGGFGHHLNVKKAAALGLFPKELEHKIHTAGNTSLAGAVLYGMEEKKEEFLELVEKAEDILLAEHPLFEEIYLKQMFFHNLDTE